MDSKYGEKIHLDQDLRPWNIRRRMWNLDFQKFGLPESISLAVETGTCRGNGAKALARRFPKVVSIELSRALHEKAKARLAEEGFRNVELIQGSSPELLPRILQNFPKAPVFFFLDAHWSGDSTVNWSESNWQGYGVDTAHCGSLFPSSQEQVPLLEELEAIVEHCIGPAFILIDDMKNIPAEGAGLKNNSFQGEDWSHLSMDAILERVAPRLVSFRMLKEPEQLLLVLKEQK